MSAEQVKGSISKGTNIGSCGLGQIIFVRDYVNPFSCYSACVLLGLLETIASSSKVNLVFHSLRQQAMLNGITADAIFLYCSIDEFCWFLDISI